MLHADQFLAVIALYLVVVLALIATANRGSHSAGQWARAVVVVGTVAGLLVGWLGALVWFFSRCDEACFEGAGWQHTNSAWQWWAQLGLATLGVGGMIVTERALAHGRPKLAAGSVTAASACFAAYAILTKPFYD